MRKWSKVIKDAGITASEGERLTSSAHPDIDKGRRFLSGIDPGVSAPII
jgi:hypothetical protein